MNGHTRSRDWLKMMNPEAPAVKREAEEDWGRRKVEMTDQKPWRLEDLVFEFMGDALREIATIVMGFLTNGMAAQSYETLRSVGGDG